MDVKSGSSRALSPFAEGARQLRELVHLPPIETFPVGHATMMAFAGIVGLYVGLAVGLFSNLVALFQIILFRPSALIHALTGQDPRWRHAFHEGLLHAHWHPEYAAIAVLGWATSRVLARVALGRWLTGFASAIASRIRILGWLFTFGLFFYYPLLLVTTVHRAFGEVHGGLFQLAQGVPALWRIVVPALGGLAVGWALQHFAPEAGGHGVTEVMEAVTVRERRIPTRVAAWKSLFAGLVIGSGGSAGREGPVVHIGGALASGVGSRLSMPRQDVSLLLACGGGAGIAASFNSPIGGTFFALEIILGDFGVRSIAPIALACVSATLTGRSLAVTGVQGAEIAKLRYLVHGLEIGPYLLLGVLSALVAVLYVRAVHQVEKLFREGWFAKVPFPARLALGGLGVGLIGAFLPRVLGNGYQTMNEAMLGELTAGTMVAVLAGKIVASGFTLGSGAPGGSFFPAVFMGAMLGGSFRVAGHHLFPSLFTGPGPYAAVGMAAVVAGATQAPLTAILMLFELTGSYQIILPLMVACTVSVAGAHWALGGGMYSLALRNKGLDLNRLRGAPFAGMRVGEAMNRDVHAMPSTASFEELVHRLGTAESFVTVVDTHERLLGVVTATELQPFFDNPDLARLVVAADLVRTTPVAVEEESLDDVVDRLARAHDAFLIAVDSIVTLRPIGVLSQRDVVLAFARAQPNVSGLKPSAETEPAQLTSPTAVDPSEP